MRTKISAITVFEATTGTLMPTRSVLVIIIIIILYCTTLAKRRLLRRVRVKNRGGSVGVCVGVCMCVCVCARVRTHMSGYIYMQGRVYNCSEAIP